MEVKRKEKESHVDHMMQTMKSSLYDEDEKKEGKRQAVVGRTSSLVDSRK